MNTELIFQTFVGRNDALAKLDNCLMSAIKGEIHLIFLAGEAGSGKSWLIREFCKRAEQKYDDLIVSSGNCAVITQDIGVQPYQPFKDVLHTLFDITNGRGSR